MENLWGGFTSDEAKELQGSSYDGIVFGLNDKVTITQFEYSTKTGKGGAEGNGALIIELEINGGKKSTRIYEPGGMGFVYFKNEQIKDKKDPRYLQGLKSAVMLAKGLITHYLKAVGYTDETLTKNLSTAKSFEDLCNKAAKAMAKHITSETPIHLFGQYQNKIVGDANQTYVEIPGNLAFGAFLSPALEGKWEADTSNGGLRYLDEEGNEHVFKRDKNYMESSKANKQTREGGANPSAAAFQLPSASDLAPSGAEDSSEEGDDDDWD